jgi:sugar lactone lactonase YvrE
MMRILRACALSLAGLLSLVPQANSQTIEIYAGGAKFRNTPANQVPVVPTTVAIGPDGMVYVSDAAKGRLLRFDPVTNTATALPGIDPQPPDYIPTHDFSFSANALAVNPSGQLFGADWDALFRVNVLDGTRQFFTDSQWPVGTNFQMAFDANGNLFYLKRDNAIYSGTGVYRRNPWGFTERLTQGTEGNFHGDGGPLAWAGFGHMRGVALDAQGNLYLADSDSNRVRKVTAINGEIDRENSIVTTVAGNGQYYSYEEGVPATSTGLGNPESLAIDAAGNLFIHERSPSRVRRVSAADGTISTYVGNGTMGYSGDGGPASEASIDPIFGNIMLDAASNLYIADMGSNRLRRVDAATGIIETVLGNGTMTFCTEVSARLQSCLGGPQGVAVDAAGNVYVSDSRNLRIRRIDAATGELRTIAGTGFSYTHGGDGGPATAASFASDPGGITFDAVGNLLIAGNYANNVRRIDMATGIITTIAGTGDSGFSGDGGPATAARFSGVRDVATDAAGNLYLSDTGNRRIRKISPSGIVSTIAGNGTNGFSGDDGPATAAALQFPGDIEVDAAGNVLFIDYIRLRRIDAATGIITTVAGNATGGINGDGGPATAAGIGYLPALHLDGAGNILLAYSGTVRRIDAMTGIINPVSPYWLTTFDGQGIANASAMAFSPQGSLFITDSDSDLVFRVDGVFIAAPDSTPPVVTPVVNGEAGVQGWYRSDVSLSWSVSDPESAVSSSNGCSATSVTTDTSGVTFTCSATSGGGTSTQSVTIRRDSVAPVVNILGTYPEPDAFGWFQNNVAVDFRSEDALSGVYSESTSSPLLVQQEGNGVTGTLVVTDRAGNTATYTSAPFNIDKTPPSIGSSRNGRGGNDDWYTEDVLIDFTVEDLVSPIRSSQGCDDVVFSTDSPATTFTCTATSAGGTQTQTLTLKRDATPPTLVFGPPSPAPNASGWHSGNVSFSFTASDGTSGVASTSSSGPLVITGEGEGLTATVTVTDVAGNTASFTTPPVNIARSVPTVQPVVSGTLGNNSWYTSNVQISWNVTGSQTSNGCDTSNVTTDTAGVTFTCTATSAAGSATKSVTVKRDATPPVLTFGTPSPVPNANGWNKTNVSISFTRSDAMSGLASTSATSPLAFNTEGAASTRQVTVTDLAGNTATFTTVPVNIDKTVPYAEIQVPEDTATYGFYSDMVAQYECIDTSLVSCTGPNPIGGLISTTTAGTRTYKITAKDQVGFTTTHTHTFTVASTFNFDGFLAPVRMPSTLNLVTHGSLVPIRWRLPDGNGGFVSNTASFTSATVATLTCGSTTAVPLNDTAIGPAGISFDAGTSAFTYNWQTDSSWTGCRKLTIKLKDNSTHELRFKFQ